MNAYEIIHRKRDGQELTVAELEYMVLGFVDGRVEDYQMSAFLMAIFFTGATDAETEALTRIMLDSGEVLDMSGVDGPKVDKHSTGGVGDKLSLIIAPGGRRRRRPGAHDVRAGGSGTPAGRSTSSSRYPGMRTDFPPERVHRNSCRRWAWPSSGSRLELAPADRKMYALRDVTATVECVPLIVGSILSKKLAAGLDALVLDVKVGRGAFMGDVERAALAGGRAGQDRRAAGASRDRRPDRHELLRWGGPSGTRSRSGSRSTSSRAAGRLDVRETSLALAARMILMAGMASTSGEAGALAEAALDDGRALEVFARFVEAQGGDAGVDRRSRTCCRAPTSSARLPPRAPGSSPASTRSTVGLAATALGARTQDGGGGGRPRSRESRSSLPWAPPCREGDVVALVHCRRKDAAEDAVQAGGLGVRVRDRCAFAGLTD